MERSSLDLFDHNRCCPKCGLDHAGSIVYLRTITAPDSTILQDVIARTCQRCGVVWYERPLDDEAAA
jgi:ribosomal protein S27AE